MYASFQICIWISPMCCSISFNNTSEIFKFRWSGSLVSSWKPRLFYRPFFYLQNVDFEGSHKADFESFVLNTVITDKIIYTPVFSDHGKLIDYHHNVYSNKCLLFLLGNCEVSSILMSIKVFQQSFKAGYQRKILFWGNCFI